MRGFRWADDEVDDGFPDDIEWGGLTGEQAQQAYDNCN